MSAMKSEPTHLFSSEIVFTDFVREWSGFPSWHRVPLPCEALGNDCLNEGTRITQEKKTTQVNNQPQQNIIFKN